MKKTKKLILTIFVAATMALLLCFAAYAQDGITSFSVEVGANDSSVCSVNWFQNSNDGKYYIFLPTGVSDDSLKISFSASDKVTCGSTVLSSGETTEVFSNGSAVLSCAGNTYNIEVLQSDSIGSVYIGTQSGSLDAIHADKDHKEPGSALIIDKGGNVQYDGELEYIKGRGNSTWSLDKKPYNIKLDKKTDLFGMGKSKKWCMLANANDATLIRNSLSYDLARNLGIDVTSDTAQVNVYINGDYQGVYVITEKVEVGSNRVDIFDLEEATQDVNSEDIETYPLAGAQNSTTWGSIKYAKIPNNPENITGGYLLELEKIYRYPDEASGFITDIGQPVVIKTPEYATKKQAEYISSYYQEFENALYSSTGYNSKGKHYTDYIDIDSLARMYILQEFTANFDGCSSSFYLYKDTDGKIFAGPAWDFDLSLGTAMPNHLINDVENVADPNLLYMQTCFVGPQNKAKNSLLAQAFSHSDFQSKVQEIWNSDFAGYYNTFRQNISDYSTALSSSAVMNGIRWNIFGTPDKNAIRGAYLGNVNAVTAYADARYPFLSKAYSPNTYFLKYDVGAYGESLVNDVTIYSAGDKAVVANAPETSSTSMIFDCWSESPDGSGKTYKPGDEITISDNTNLYAQWKKDTLINRIIKTIKRVFERIAEIFNALFGKQTNR